LIGGAVRDANLHPMNYFFLSAGYFAFHLLFAYLVDVLPLHVSFLISATVSMLLVSGYVRALAGKALSLVSIPAQFAYMILFSYSFFFDGYSGLTIAIGAVATLAFLMITTVKIDWSEKFAPKPRSIPPPITA
jgi:inner membrane protein involved in colicin E2 resistance